MEALLAPDHRSQQGTSTAGQLPDPREDLIE